jgi:hypothetical protein
MSRLQGWSTLNAETIFLMRDQIPVYQEKGSGKATVRNKFDPDILD